MKKRNANKSKKGGILVFEQERYMLDGTIPSSMSDLFI